MLLLAAFCALQAYAQPYSISFAGSGLSSVKVENLTSGLTVNLNAGDVLRLSLTTGISDVTNVKSGIKIYPNPMTDKSTLQILPPVSGDAIISVCDMTGKVVTQFKGYVENNLQEFSLSGITNGFHIVKVQGNGYNFSEKFFSNAKLNGKAIIASLSNNIQAVEEKKSIYDSKGSQGTVEMIYHSGERLKYTGVSGNNSTVMTAIPVADNTVTFTFVECKDGDNNYYPVVYINSQAWMAVNLKTTKFKNGLSAIPLVTDNIAWSNLVPGYGFCWYNNDAATYKSTYGALYNWYCVSSGNLCPTGWHVPSDAEWTTFENYLITNGYDYDGTTAGNKISKSLASTSGWTSNTTTGAVGNTDYPAKRNATAFTALPGGCRSVTGTFGEIGNSCYFWTSTSGADMDSYCRLIIYNGISSGRYHSVYTDGYSVRCLKD